MTHSGGKPHAVGDRQQRFEVTFFDPDKGLRRPIGWANTIEGANALCGSVRAHPVWRKPLIRDRLTHPDPLSPPEELP